VEHDVALEAPHLVVPWTDPLCGPFAAAVHNRPSEAMAVVGVTGTNGKTTVTYLLQAACRAEGLRTGLVGTIETQVGDRSSPSRSPPHRPRTCSEPWPRCATRGPTW
jgi:UDP-N-acetylmuramoyl-L-alanyl-D-glutamate--2,6-diaminopimelate ligase